MDLVSLALLTGAVLGVMLIVLAVIAIVVLLPLVRRALAERETAVESETDVDLETDVDAAVADAQTAHHNRAEPPQR